MTTAPVASASASTSISTASSRNLSIRIGRSGDACTAWSCSGRARPCRRRSPSRGRRARRTGGPRAGIRSSRATSRASSGDVAVPLAACGMPSSHSSLEKRSRSSARSIESGDVPRILTPAACSGSASLSGVWPPYCTTHATSPPASCSRVDDRRDVLEGERLEVQPIDGVVVGRDRLRVAVDHDRLEPVVAQGERRVHAAVVELDALPDPVGAAAEDDDLLPRRRIGLALLLVRAVQVRRERLELGGAGIDALVGGDRGRARGARRGRRPRRRRACCPSCQSPKPARFSARIRSGEMPRRPDERRRVSSARRAAGTASGTSDRSW